MSRELDAAVAQALGWHWDNKWGCMIPPTQVAPPDEMWTDWLDDGGGEEYREPIKAYCLSGVVYNGNFTKIILPEYSADIAASRTMEDWIDEHGLQARYAMAVMSVFLEGDRVPDHDELLWWMLLHATPEQRCLAFLKARGVDWREEE